MRYQAAIFDMDGTVLNTLTDLCNGINYALGQCGHRHDFTEKDAALFVGSGIHVAFQRALAMEAGAAPDDLEAIGAGADVAAMGVEIKEADRLQEVFRPYYSAHCTDMTAPYPGILELLQRLRDAGVKTAVVSNKPDYAVQKITPDYFPGLFDLAMGEHTNVRRKPAPDMVEAALVRLGVEKEAAVYIGDSEIDVQTAANSGLACICVSWGFRGKDFLLRHGATTIVDDTRGLWDALHDLPTTCLC